MNGIRIYGQPLFAEIFAPILNELNGLTWLTGVEPFLASLAWLDESIYDEATDTYVSGPAADLERDVRLITDDRGKAHYGCYAQVDLFPKYARIVHEDWNAFFGIDKAIPDPLAWWKGYWDTSNRAAYLNDCHVCFRNVDAAFWEFYTREPRLLELLKAHLKNLDVSTEPCQLEESLGL